MSWFKVDDALSDHPKAVDAGNRPMGLWVMSGSRASRYLTDGFRARAVRALLRGGIKDADTLIEVGLWHPGRRRGLAVPRMVAVEPDPKPGGSRPRSTTETNSEVAREPGAVT